MGIQLPSQVSPQTLQIVELLASISLALQKFGFKVAPYRAANIQQIENLDSESQKLMQIHAQSYFTILSQAPDFVDALQFQKEMLQKTLDRLGFEPCDDFFDRIASDDVLEIHTLDGIQVYRSFSFFQYCSFNLFELLSYKWHELYDRPRKSTQDIETQVRELMSSMTKTVAVNWENHLVKERKDDPLLVELSFKFISPLKIKGTDQMCAALTSKACRILSEEAQVSNVFVLG